MSVTRLAVLGAFFCASVAVGGQWTPPLRPSAPSTYASSACDAHSILGATPLTLELISLGRHDMLAPTEAQILTPIPPFGSVLAINSSALAGSDGRVATEYPLLVWQSGPGIILGLALQVRLPSEFVAATPVSVYVSSAVSYTSAPERWGNGWRRIFPRNASAPTLLYSDIISTIAARYGRNLDDRYHFVSSEYAEVTYLTSRVLLLPTGASVNTTGPACMLTLAIESHCCTNLQPPTLIVQPYGVIIASVVAAAPTRGAQRARSSIACDAGGAPSGAR
jgi:hypothetical protein